MKKSSGKGNVYSAVDTNKSMTSGIKANHALGAKREAGSAPAYPSRNFTPTTATGIKGDPCKASGMKRGKK